MKVLKKRILLRNSTMIQEIHRLRLRGLVRTWRWLQRVRGVALCSGAYLGRAEDRRKQAHPSSHGDRERHPTATPVILDLFLGRRRTWRIQEVVEIHAGRGRGCYGGA